VNRQREDFFPRAAFSEEQNRGLACRRLPRGFHGFFHFFALADNQTIRLSASSEKSSTPFEPFPDSRALRTTIRNDSHRSAGYEVIGSSFIARRRLDGTVRGDNYSWNIDSILA